MGKLLEIAFKNQTVLKATAKAAVRYVLGYAIGLGVRYLGQEFAPQLSALANDLEPLVVMLIFSWLAKAHEAKKAEGAK